MMFSPSTLLMVHTLSQEMPTASTQFLKPETQRQVIAFSSHSSASRSQSSGLLESTPS